METYNPIWEDYSLYIFQTHTGGNPQLGQELRQADEKLRWVPFVCSQVNSMILITFISLAAGRKVFQNFLRSEFSEENILFWLACEDLKKEGSPEVVEEKARLIYEDYISILSPRRCRWIRGSAR